MQFSEVYAHEAGGKANAQIAKDGYVEIAFNRRDKSITFLMGHEFTHRMQDLSPEQYVKFKESAKEFLGEEAWNERLARMKQTYIYNKERFDRTLLEDEVVADFVGQLVEQADAFDRYINSVNDKGILATIAKVFRSIRDFIFNADAEAAKPLTEMSDKLDILIESSEVAQSETQEMEYLGEKNTAQGKERHSLIGEQGAANLDKAEEATTRLDNLAVAREMETEGKDAKAIRMATDWERGADGLWRYEIMDAEVTLYDGDENTIRKKIEVAEEEEKDFMQQSKADTKELRERTNTYLAQMREKYGVAEGEETDAMTEEEIAQLQSLTNKEIEFEDYKERRRKELYNRRMALEAQLGYVRVKNTDDSAMILFTRLGHILHGNDAEVLFAAYPSLRDIEVQFVTDIRDGAFAAYATKGGYKRIELNAKKTPVDMIAPYILHEVQHAIQDIEGFAGGGNLSSLQSDENVTAKEAYDYYHKIAGEVEARNVSARINMTPEERRATLLSETEDVAREDQIFLREGAQMAMSQPKFSLATDVASILDEYDTEGVKYGSILDVADAIESLIAESTEDTAELENILDNFRAAQDDARRWGNRMDSGGEEEFEEALRAYASQGQPKFSLSALEKDLQNENISIDNKAILDTYGLSSLTMSKRGNYVTLSKIVVDDRGKGNGTRFMNDLVRLADGNGWILALTPDTSFGATSERRLKGFYKRFGFNENKGRNTDFSTRESMVRKPQDDVKYVLANRVVSNVVLADTADKKLPSSKEEAFEYIPQGGISIFNGDIGANINVSRKAVKHTALHHQKDEYAIFAGIQQIVANAVKVGNIPVAEDEIGHTHSVSIMYVPINVNGTQYSARLLVKELENKGVVLEELLLYNVSMHKERGYAIQPLNASDEVGGITAKPQSFYKVKKLIHNSQEIDKKILGINEVTRFSLITPEMDASYLDAVERGTLTEAQVGEAMGARYSMSSPEETAYSNARYSIQETDPVILDALNNGATMKVYRAMQVIDGELYPPMSAKVDGKLRNPIKIGVWERAEERPDLADEKGNFKLDKGNKTSLKARYNPYIHTSLTPLNDQFSSAQDRPNLVTVEVEVPVSELTSGYKAEKAKDAVGKLEWKAGVVQGQLTGTRTVILSRWDRPIRIVPDSEVAQRIVEMFGDTKVVMPSNVVTPSLRTELEKLGVPFKETTNQGKQIEGLGDVKVSQKGNSVFGPVYEGFTGRPKEAARFLSKKENGEAKGVFYLPDYGEISLVWGNNGGGLYHINKKQIIEGRSFKSLDEAVETIDNAVKRGKIIFENGDKIVLEEGDNLVTIRRNYRERGKKIADKNWILSAYDTTAGDDTSAISGINKGQAAQTPAEIEGKDTISSAKKQTNVGKFSLITPEMDAAYLDAVERGDMATAQRMVMEAANERAKREQERKNREAYIQSNMLQVYETTKGIEVRTGDSMYRMCMFR